MGDPGEEWGCPSGSGGDGHHSYPMGVGTSSRAARSRWRAEMAAGKRGRESLGEERRDQGHRERWQKEIGGSRAGRAGAKKQLWTSHRAL